MEDEYFFQLLSSGDQEATFNKCGYSKSKTSWWRTGSWAWAYSKDHQVFKFSTWLQSTYAAIFLSTDTDCNEQGTAATGQSFLRMLSFLLLENFEREGDIIIEFFFHGIFIDTSKFSVVKQENLHDALLNCRLSPFVAVNILELSDAIFNSVQITHSTSTCSKRR